MTGGQAEQHFGVDISSRRQLNELQRLEQTHGGKVHDWIDEGMPREAMGTPDEMRAFRIEEGTDVLANGAAETGQSVQRSTTTNTADEAGLSLEIDPDPQLEREAEQTAQRVMQGGGLGVQRLGKTDLHIQRFSMGDVGGMGSNLADGAGQAVDMGSDIMSTGSDLMGGGGGGGIGDIASMGSDLMGGGGGGLGDVASMGSDLMGGGGGGIGDIASMGSGLMAGGGGGGGLGAAMSAGSEMMSGADEVMSMGSDIQSSVDDMMSTGSDMMSGAGEMADIGSSAGGMSEMPAAPVTASPATATPPTGKPPAEEPEIDEELLEKLRSNDSV